MDLDEEIKSREEGEIDSESREKGDLLHCSSPLLQATKAHINIMFFFKQDGFAKSNQVRKKSQARHKIWSCFRNFCFWVLTLTQLLISFFG